MHRKRVAGIKGQMIGQAVDDASMLGKPDRMRFTVVFRAKSPPA
jgi:hypothetical protein